MTDTTRHHEALADGGGLDACDEQVHQNGAGGRAPQTPTSWGPGTRADLLERRCVAKSKRSQRRCEAFAIRGGTVCHIHGGKSPQAKAAAAKRLATAAALKKLSLLGAPVGDIDPAKLVLDQIGDAAGQVANLRAWLETLTPAEALESDVLKRFDAEREKVVKWAATSTAMDVSVRRLELAESLGGAVTDVLVAVLDRLELAPEQRALGLATGAEQLRVIAGSLIEGKAS